MSIHPTAIVSDQASIGNDVEIGAYAIIDGPAVIGDGCQIAAHVQILGSTQLAEGNRIGPAAIIGGLPQDLSFDPSTVSHVSLGAHNDIREHVTIHRSATAGETTVLGEKNFLMAGVHLGHDCQVGNHNIIANNALLGGHVEIGDGAFIGGGSVVHQFVRIGDRVMTQGNSGFSLDLPPFVIGFEINRIAGLNVIGLRRAGFSKEARAEIKELFRLFYRARLTKRAATDQAVGQPWGEDARALLDFLTAPSKKGVCLRMKASAGESQSQ